MRFKKLVTAEKDGDWKETNKCLEIGDSRRRRWFWRANVLGCSPFLFMLSIFFSFRYHYPFFKPTFSLLTISIGWIAHSLFISRHLSLFFFPSWSNASLASVTSHLKRTFDKFFRLISTNQTSGILIQSREIMNYVRRGFHPNRHLSLASCAGDGHSGQIVSFASLIPPFVSHFHNLEVFLNPICFYLTFTWGVKLYNRMLPQTYGLRQFCF